MIIIIKLFAIAEVHAKKEDEIAIFGGDNLCIIAGPWYFLQHCRCRANLRTLAGGCCLHESFYFLVSSITFWIEKSRHSILLVHDMKGYVNPLADLPSLNLLPLDQVGPVSVDDCVECHAILPRGGKIVHFDAGVASSGLLGPPEQGLLGCNILLSNNNI